MIVARNADAVGHITAGVSFRQNNASSEDAGTWTVTDSNRGNGIAAIIAVRPARESADSRDIRITGDDPLPFPQNPVLDTFNRSNENPATGIWTGPVIASEGNIQVSSNQAVGVDSGIYNSRRTSETFAANAEAYVTLPAVDTGNRVEAYVRGFVDGSGTDGYCVSVVGTTWSLRVVTNSSSSAIGANYTHGSNLAAGDSVGIRIVGTELQA